MKRCGEDGGKQVLKLAVVQMFVECGNKPGNLAHAGKLIGEAAANGARIVLLPEAMDLGWTHPAAAGNASAVPDGDTCAALRRAAREHNVFVCSGLVERDGDTIYNSAVYIGRDGDVLLHYRKLNELEIGFDYYAQGNMLNVCRTECGSIGLLICADANAEHSCLSRALCYMGADIILSPAAWAVPPDHDNAKSPYGDTWRHAYTPIARDYAVWFCGASSVGPMHGGPWDGWRNIGCSLVVDADGREVVQGPYGENAETVLYVDVELKPRPARGCGWGVYHAKHGE